MRAKVSNRFGAIKDTTYTLFRHLLAHPDQAIVNDNTCKNAAWNDPTVQMSVKCLKGYLGEQGAIDKFSQIFNQVAKMVNGDGSSSQINDTVPFSSEWQDDNDDEQELSMAVLLPQDVDIDMDLDSTPEEVEHYEDSKAVDDIVRCGIDIAKEFLGVDDDEEMQDDFDNEYPDSEYADDYEEAIKAELDGFLHTDTDGYDKIVAFDDEDEDEDVIDDEDIDGEEDAEWMNAQPPAMGYFGFGGKF